MTDFDYEREVYRAAMDAADVAAAGPLNPGGLTMASERAVHAALLSVAKNLLAQTDDQRRLSLHYLRGRVG